VHHQKFDPTSWKYHGDEIGAPTPAVEAGRYTVLAPNSRREYAKPATELTEMGVKNIQGTEVPFVVAQGGLTDKTPYTGVVSTLTEDEERNRRQTYQSEQVGNLMENKNVPAPRWDDGVRYNDPPKDVLRRFKDTAHVGRSLRNSNAVTGTMQWPKSDEAAGPADGLEELVRSVEVGQARGYAGEVQAARGAAHAAYAGDAGAPTGVYQAPQQGDAPKPEWVTALEKAKDAQYQADPTQNDSGVRAMLGRRPTTPPKDLRGAGGHTGEASQMQGVFGANTKPVVHYRGKHVSDEAQVLPRGAQFRR